MVYDFKQWFREIHWWEVGVPSRRLFFFFNLTGDGSGLHLGLNLSSQAPEEKKHALTAKLADLKAQRNED